MRRIVNRYRPPVAVLTVVDQAVAVVVDAVSATLHDRVGATPAHSVVGAKGLDAAPVGRVGAVAIRGARACADRPDDPGREAETRGAVLRGDALATELESLGGREFG
jgi:hypothetical protein